MLVPGDVVVSVDLGNLVTVKTVERRPVSSPRASVWITFQEVEGHEFEFDQDTHIALIRPTPMGR